MQQEVQSREVDKFIYKFRRLNPSMTWKDISEEIYQRFHLSYSINDLISRYEALTAKLPQDKILWIFEEFQRWETNFKKISEATNIAVDPVKREILSVLANNIIKVCFIVRKRKISTLKSNFLSNQKTKELLILILSSNNFPQVKQEYAIFWNFISKYYPDNQFLTISDEQYRSVYRELIILAEAFRINSNQQEDPDAAASDSFERKIIESNGSGKDHIKQMLDLTRSKHRKNQKQTINLVSQDEMSDDDDNENEFMGIEMREQPDERFMEAERKRQIKENILRQQVSTHLQLTMLDERMEIEGQGQEIRQKRLHKIVSLGCLRLLSLKMDCE